LLSGKKRTNNKRGKYMNKINHSVTLKVLLLYVSFNLIGCATGYYSNRFTGGYSEIQIQDDIFKVKFRGNAYIDKDEVADYTLLRCAEVTLENGFSYFIIIEEKTDVRTYAYTTPTTAKTYGTVNYPPNVYSTIYSETTEVSGGKTYTYKKPSGINTIKCFNGDPGPIAPIVYDARKVKSYIRKQYMLDD